MRRILLVTIVVLLLAQFNRTKVYAFNEFTSFYVSTYEVLPTGSTQVTHDITIKNNLSQVYTTDYSVSIGSNRLKNVSVIEDGKSLTPKVVATENQTTININFTDPAVGKEQEKRLYINYINDDIATKLGRIWEINVPKLANANEIGQHRRIIIVPESFPDPSVIIPPPSSQEIREGSRYYVFDNNHHKSITALFGQYQVYELKLDYAISNPTLSTTETEIAIPPDTEYQEVFVKEIVPAPKSIVLDDDGNWLARYLLEPQQKFDAKVSLFVKVYAQPTLAITYPQTSLNYLLKTHKYWDVEAENVRLLADQLKSPDQIYNYLVDHFTYGYSRVGPGALRLGAKEALNSPTSAICMEFTDTFVALARRNGIPTREINGYAYTTNSSLRPLGTELDVLHAWPEYYDESMKTWRQVDPTWGSTTGGVDYLSKLDFNHITFVRHGVESTYPYPAGTYKQDVAKKDLAVSVVESDPEAYENIQVNLEGDSGRKNDQASVRIRNLGNRSLHQKTITVEGQSIRIAYLPPYGETSVNLSRKTNAFPWWALFVGGGLLVGVLGVMVISRRHKI